MSCDHAPATGDSVDTRLLAEYLAWDLSRVSGILGEIATCWRRAHDSLPDLPLGLPAELGEIAGQAGADMRALTDAEPGARTELALRGVRRIAALREACDSASALTRVTRADVAGDRELWESVTGTLDRAGLESLSILLQTATVTGWTLDDEPRDGSGTWLRLRLG